MHVELNPGVTTAGYFSEGGAYELNCKKGYQWLDESSIRTSQRIRANWADFTITCQGKHEIEHIYFFQWI